MNPIKVNFEEIEPPEERQPPEGGWKRACMIADHKWVLGIEEGRAYLECLDPHPESFMNEVEPGHVPVCCDSYWEREDLGTEKPIPVVVEHVDDSTPSTPNGPAEYGFYIVIKPDRELAGALEGVLDWATRMPGFHISEEVKRAQRALEVNR